MSRTLVIGVDAGATSTRCVVATLDGVIVSRGRAGGANPNSSGGHLAETLTTAIEAALSGITLPRSSASGHPPEVTQPQTQPGEDQQLCDEPLVAAPILPGGQGVDRTAVRLGVLGAAGSAGAGRVVFREAAEQAWARAGLTGEVVTVTDLEVAFAAGTNGSDGALLLSGTGALAARFAGGVVERRCDGYGWLAGDEGSAVWLGVQALRAALAALDGRGEPTTLVPLLCDRLGITRPAWMPGAGHRSVAEQVPASGEPVRLPLPGREHSAEPVPAQSEPDPGREQPAEPVLTQSEPGAGREDPAEPVLAQSERGAGREHPAEPVLTPSDSVRLPGARRERVAQPVAEPGESVRLAGAGRERVAQPVAEPGESVRLSGVGRERHADPLPTPSEPVRLPGAGRESLAQPVAALGESARLSGLEGEGRAGAGRPGSQGPAQAGAGAGLARVEREELAQALVAAGFGRAPAELGLLAPAVSVAAEAGDAVARRIVNAAAAKLLHALDTVEPPAGGVVVVAGSVLLSAGPVARAVRQGLLARSGVEPREALDGAGGAAVLAIGRLTGRPVSQVVHARLAGGAGAGRGHGAVRE